MPRKGRRKKKLREKGGRGDASLVPVELTVNDFANNEAPRGNHTMRVNMQTVIKEQTVAFKEDDRSWEEKEDEDSDLLCANGAEGHEPKGQNEVKDGSNETEGSSYFEFPLDFWFLISEKILPEDVGRFAAICRATYYVVSTARFWFFLYKRYYSLTSDLPVSLAYHNMDNTRGLKPAVIRSLFYMYTPFITQLAKEKPLSGHPTKLIGAQCVSQWSSQVGTSGKYEKYYFIFAKQVKRKKLGQSIHSLLGTASETIVNLNPEEGCYILETICSSSCHIPVVIGNHLHNGHLGLSAGFCAHRLQLVLGPAYLLSKMNHKHLQNSEMTQIILEPVVDVRIYPWWHPKYEKSLPSKVSCDDGDPF